VPKILVASAIIAFISFINQEVSAKEPHRDGPFPREGECNIEDAFFARYKKSIVQDKNIGPGTLKGTHIPTPSNLADFVKNRDVALVLGKALFWDMQVGSDGIQACASCHFSAGADPRTRGQISAGGKHFNDAVVTLKEVNAGTFPLNKPRDVANRGFGLVSSTDDIVGSQGIVAGIFGSAQEGHGASRGVRRVTQRNTPSVINSVLYHRNFWDGRAETIFNGVNHSGLRDDQARVARLGEDGKVVQVKVRIPDASLASLAVAPIVDPVEMSFEGRTTRDIGRALLDRVPLAKQHVHAEDSVLGRHARSDKGLADLTYRRLTEDAFVDVWWAATPESYRDGEGFSQIEQNFSLFFGLAIREYLATLVSDDARIDQHFDRLKQGEPGLLNEQELRGATVFEENACKDCHNGPEFAGSVYRTAVSGFDNPAFTPSFQHPEEVERMTTADCGVRLYDQGFYNIGVRPFDEDLGLGANDDFGNPLSAAKILVTDPKDIVSKELLNDSYPNLGELGLVKPFRVGEPTAVLGTFKIPSLRNVALTAPYFHTGGYATLKQVVQFYNRGGDYRDYISEDGISQLSMIDLGVGRLGLTEQEIDDLVAFLETFTDQRVVNQSAPFDHPEIFIPHGARADGVSADAAEQEFLPLAAVGARGGEPIMLFEMKDTVPAEEVPTR
jgi:cytochrome c peroxidase